MDKKNHDRNVSIEVDTLLTTSTGVQYGHHIDWYEIIMIAFICHYAILSGDTS